jgi:hypothetical protein
MLVAFHRVQEAKLTQALQADLEKIGLASAAANRSGRARDPFTARDAAPPAEAAAVIARPKNAIERPAIAAVRGGKMAVEATRADEQWEKLAALHADDARLDNASRNLIASQNPTAAVAGRLAITKRLVESPLVKLFRNLEQSVAVDSVRNEYELHRKLHRWFVEGTAPANVDELNERVYAELFLTPKSDPWLGLLPGDAYAALPNNGVSVASQK